MRNGRRFVWRALQRPEATQYSRKIYRESSHDFDTLPLLDIKKPRVGIVGEILVKFLPSANNHLVEPAGSRGSTRLLCQISWTSSCTASTTTITTMSSLARPRREP